MTSFSVPVRIEMASPPASITAYTPATITLRMPRAGTALIRVRWSPQLRLHNGLPHVVSPAAYGRSQTRHRRGASGSIVRRAHAKHSSAGPEVLYRHSPHRPKPGTCSRRSSTYQKRGQRDLDLLHGAIALLLRRAEQPEDIGDVVHLMDAWPLEVLARPLPLGDEAVQQEHLLAVLDREAGLHFGSRRRRGLDDDGALAHTRGDHVPQPRRS